MNKRIKYLDELRNFACCLIILLHIIAIFSYKYFKISTLEYAFTVFLSSFTRVGIPLFFMMTGILMLNKKEEKNYFDFFKKRVMKLIVAYIFFSIVYYVYHLILSHGQLSIFELIRQITSSTTEYHLWFMPVIITIYIFIPFIKKFVENLTNKELKLFIVIVFILSNGIVFIRAISEMFGYSLMSSFILPNLLSYTNFVLLGYYLGKINYKINKKLVLLSILSIISMPIFTILITKDEVTTIFLNALSPFVIAPSILVFLFFKNKKKELPETINSLLKKNANNVFYIYLIHVLILNIIYNHYIKELAKTTLIQDLGIMLLLWIVVTISSFIFAYLWNKIKEIIKKNYEKICAFLIQLFSIIFIFIFSCILLSLVINHYHFIKINYITCIIGIIILVLLFYLINKYQDKIFKHKVINIISIIIYLLIQVIVAYCFMVKPTWDFGQIYDIAVNFAKNSNPVFGSAYLYVCDNNIMYSVFMDIYYKIAYLIGIKSHYIELGIILNILMIDICLIYLYLLIKRINAKYSKAFMFLIMFFSPFIFYIPIFYTDTLSLPFTIIPLYYLHKYFFNNQKIRYIIITGLIIGIGSMLKPTTLIILIAVIVYLIIVKNKKVNYYLFIPILLICVITPLIGQRIFINHFFDKEARYNYRIPTIHYFLIGMENNGEYSEKRYKEINKEIGEEIKIKITKEKINKRANELIKEHEIIPFYVRKISYTWTDGTFFSFEKLRRSPVHEEYTKYVYSDSNKDLLYWTISNSQWIIIIVLLIMGTIFRKYLPKETKDFQLLCHICIFGLFLFLLIWETRSRYLVNFLPIVLLDAYIGVIAITNYINKDRRIKE